MKGLIFTLGMTYGGALISLFKPYYGFLIYVAFANLKPDALWFWSVPEGNYSRIIAIAFLIGWGMSAGKSWKLGRGAVMIYALLFYWIWIALGALISPAQPTAMASFEVLSKVFLPLIAALTLIDSLEKLKQLAWTLVLSQGFLALNFNERYYTWGIDTNSWTFAGMDNNAIAITMVSVVGLAFFVGTTAERWWHKGIAFAAAGLMGHVVLFSMSRGGMLALAVTGGAAFLLIPKRPVHFISLFVAVLIVLRLAGADVRDEFFSSFADKEVRDESAQSRFDLTRDAIDCMLRHPLLGCGMENWGNIAPEYGWPLGKRAHNTWAEIGATLGIPGLLALLTFYGTCCWRLIPFSMRSNRQLDPWVPGIARAVLSGLVGFFISAAAVTTDRVEIPYYLVLLGAGVLKLDSLGLTNRQGVLSQQWLGGSHGQTSLRVDSVLTGTVAAR